MSNKNMTNRLKSLLERGTRIRQMIELRSRDKASSDLQILRLRRLSLLISQRLEQCLAATIPAPPGLAMAYAKTTR